jgi:enoyl-ACP reductase-like protein
MTTSDDSPVSDYSALRRLDDRAFLVVGAGQGMGRQNAHALASQGAHLVCVDIDATLAKEVADEVGGVACVADVRKEEDAKRVVVTAKEAFGRRHGVADVVCPVGPPWPTCRKKIGTGVATWTCAMPTTSSSMEGRSLRRTVVARWSWWCRSAVYRRPHSTACMARRRRLCFHLFAPLLSSFAGQACE